MTVTCILCLQDKFGNTTGTDIEGKVVVEITQESGSDDIPELVGSTRKVEIALHKGQATLQVSLARYYSHIYV